MMRKPNNHRRAVAAVVAVALLASPGCGSDAEPFVDALDTSGQEELDASTGPCWRPSSRG